MAAVDLGDGAHAVNPATGAWFWLRRNTPLVRRCSGGSAPGLMSTHRSALTRVIADVSVVISCPSAFVGQL